MNRRQKRQEDLRVAKDKKMKKVLIGLSVLLVAVLAFEVPKVIHSGGGSAPVAAVATTPTGSSSAPVASTPTTAAPTTGVATTAPGTAAAALSPSDSKLPNSDTLPKVGKGQLFAFSHFTAKDPFVQQVVDLSAGQTDSSTAGSSTSASASTAPTAATAAAVSHKQHRSTRVLAVTGAARISVNGRVQIVRVGASFPSANPLFKLVSVKNGVARIGIASGSYSSGAHTVSLGAGRSLTLVDTADGIRYQIRLLSN
jgi:hypothetical protein